MGRKKCFLCGLMIIFLLLSDVGVGTVNAEAVASTVSAEAVMTGNASTAGTWIYNSTIGKWWYRHTDGSYTVNAWEYINGNWYYFDSLGWMQTGWLLLGVNWYYLGDVNDGAMKSGWQYINGYWYYLGDVNDGAMKTGWQKVNGYWYYLNADGSMNIYPLNQNGTRYTFFQSGELQSTELNVIRQRQQRSNWCWAASSVMIGRYNVNSSITQTQVVNYVKGSVINEGGTDSEVITAIKYVSGGAKQPQISYSKTYSQLVDYIDNGHPFGMHIAWNSGGGHMIVGAGYNKGNGTIYSIDPVETVTNTYYNYQALIQGTTLETGTGHLYSLIVY